jgi:hypothetical protein
MGDPFRLMSAVESVASLYHDGAGKMCVAGQLDDARR